MTVESIESRIERLENELENEVERLTLEIKKLAKSRFANIGMRARGNGERACIVCGEHIYWPKLKTLPPACASHRYDEVFDLFEPD